ncbi:hypothetical protein [Ferruginibacter sp. SUN106]|uniref:hypothetical protein n=1 Tax=Ferruginibacter sp. SUN106 TaxID=2978348 RepID=UPI003D35C770
MYLKKHSINAIKSYCFNENLYYIKKDTNKNDLFYVDKNYNSLCILSDEDKFQEVYSIDDIVYVNTLHGKEIVIDNKKIEGFDLYFNVISFEDGQYLAYCMERDKVTNQKSTIKFDFRKNKIIWRVDKSSGFNYIGKNQFFICFIDIIKELSIIFCYNKINGELLWQFDLKELGTYKDVLSIETPYGFEKFIGEWRGQLFVGLSESLIVSLDITNGKVINKWDKINPGTTLLFSAEEKLVGLGGIGYWEIDLKTNELTITYLSEELMKQNVRGINDLNIYGVTDAHFFCAADMKIPDEPDHHIGAIVAINRQTLKIDWKYVFDDSQGQWTTLSEGPRIDNAKLYQLDSRGTLHFFEKEVDKIIV